MVPEERAGIFQFSDSAQKRRFLESLPGPKERAAPQDRGFDAERPPDEAARAAAIAPPFSAWKIAANMPRWLVKAGTFTAGLSGPTRRLSLLSKGPEDLSPLSGENWTSSSSTTAIQYSKLSTAQHPTTRGHRHFAGCPRARPKNGVRKPASPSWRCTWPRMNGYVPVRENALRAL